MRRAVCQQQSSFLLEPSVKSDGAVTGIPFCQMMLLKAGVFQINDTFSSKTAHQLIVLVRPLSCWTHWNYSHHNSTPNSLDLNPVDCSIPQEVYHTSALIWMT